MKVSGEVMKEPFYTDQRRIFSKNTLIAGTMFVLLFGPLLLTRINSRPSIDKLSHAQ